MGLASNARGLEIERSASDRVTVTVGRHRWHAEVVVRGVLSQGDAEQLVATAAGGWKVLVANQLSAEAKEVFDRYNDTNPDSWWSWLDRRGELQLNHPQASGAIHFDNPSLRGSTTLPGTWRLASPASDGPIRGRAGISFAAALLLDPTSRPSIRATAEAAGMSHGAIGEAAKLLREAGLIRPGGEPETPDLFWALAAVWGPTRTTAVGGLPSSRRAHAGDLAEPGWALGGDDAAAAWGAPVFAAGGHPWIWVPSEAEARRVERSLTPATWDDHAAVIAVPPTLLVCRHRLRPPAPVEPPFLPTTHPLFLALELAQDPARGHEILEGWDPEHPAVHRVW